MNGYLLDENLPVQLLPSTRYPIYHTRDLGAQWTDGALWDLARQERWVIVSKDADFADRILLASPPPWIVHLRVGNLRLIEFRALIARVWPQVEALLPANKLINDYQDRIEAIAEV